MSDDNKTFTAQELNTAIHVLEIVGAQFPREDDFGFDYHNAVARTTDVLKHIKDGEANPLPPRAEQQVRNLRLLAELKR